MQRYIVKRLVTLVPILFAISIIVFAIIHLIPGDPASVLLGTESSDPELRAREIHALGLDKPLPVQYGIWLKNVLHGNLGKAVNTGEPVRKLLLQRLPFTLELALYAFLLALAIAIPLGVLSATSSSKLADFAFHSVTLFGLSIPAFWSGAMLILLFTVSLHWFPILNYPSFVHAPLQNLRSFFLPAFTLALANAAIMARMVRASILEVTQQDYIRTARAKGLKESTVVVRHMLKNAMIPIVTLIGILAGYLIGGSIVVEQVFAIPGMGRLGLEAITQRDFQTLQGVVLFGTVGFVMVNLLVDVLYVYLNPKIRYA